LLSRVLDRKGLGAKLEAASVLTEWESLVGPQIAAVTRAQKVSEGVLFVAVDSSAWMMELNLMKMELMRRVNAGKSGGRIRQIVFVMGD
jgi:predicted nucleic acid-binding Zn ribbon protein